MLSILIPRPRTAPSLPLRPTKYHPYPDTRRCSTGCNSSEWKERDYGSDIYLESKQEPEKGTRSTASSE